REEFNAPGWVHVQTRPGGRVVCHQPHRLPLDGRLRPENVNAQVSPGSDHGEEQPVGRLQPLTGLENLVRTKHARGQNKHLFEMGPRGAILEKRVCPPASRLAPPNSEYACALDNPVGPRGHAPSLPAPRAGASEIGVAPTAWVRAWQLVVG